MFRQVRELDLARYVGSWTACVLDIIPGSILYLPTGSMQKKHDIPIFPQLPCILWISRQANTNEPHVLLHPHHTAIILSMLAWYFPRLIDGFAQQLSFTQKLPTVLQTGPMMTILQDWRCSIFRRTLINTSVSWFIVISRNGWVPVTLLVFHNSIFIYT